MQAEAFAIWSSSSCSCPACSPILCWEQLCSSPARAHREALSSRAQHSQKLSTPFCPAALTCMWNFCTQKGFWGFSPWLCCRRAVGSFFPQIFRVEPISAWGWAGQLLGPPKKLPGPPVLGQAQPPVLREPSQQAEPFPAPWHEQSPRLSLEPRAGHNWGWPLPGCPQLPLVPQAGAWWPCWMEGGDEMK